MKNSEKRLGRVRCETNQTSSNPPVNRSRFARRLPAEPLEIPPRLRSVMNE